MTPAALPPRFEFGHWIVRPAAEADRPLLEQWIDQDPDHRGRVTADFFLRAVPGEDCWAMERRFRPGVPVLWFKTQAVCRLHIQFGPAQREEDRDLNRDAMRDGLEWIERQLAAHSFRELIFSSVHTPLVLAAKRRLGFRQSPHELTKAIPWPAEYQRDQEVLLQELQYRQEAEASHVR